MLFKDLLVYKRKKLYKIAKHRKDDNLNVKYDYKKNGLLKYQILLQFLLSAQLVYQQ